MKRGACAPFRIRSAFADRFSFFSAISCSRSTGRRSDGLPGGADFDAAGFAPAVLFVFDQLQGLVDFLDQLALAIAVAQFEGELFFLAGAVGRDQGSWLLRPSCGPRFCRHSISSCFQPFRILVKWARMLTHVLFTLGFL
jgi:hypothetical protein